MTNSNNLINNTNPHFRQLVLLTIVAIYLLVLAGGIVRSTGSGMGCPDWPKCFGRWIPPTSITQLPSNYQSIYGAKLKGEVVFNATKTWIEYVNRLLGVVAGFLVLAVLVSSFSYVNKDRAIFWGSVSAFILIGVNGWLGSRVVATELADYLITAHMLLAVLVLFSLLFVYIRTQKKQFVQSGNDQKLGALVFFSILISLIQIVLGTQVRDQLDEITRAVGYDQRNNWISFLNWPFYIHRSFSLIVLIINTIVIYQIRKKYIGIIIYANLLILGVLAEIATGIIMAYFGVPAFAQPVHLLLALLIIGVQFVIWLYLKSALIRTDIRSSTFSLSHS